MYRPLAAPPPSVSSRSSWTDILPSMTNTNLHVPGSGIPLLPPGRMSAWYMEN